MRRLLCGFLCHPPSTVVRRTKLHLTRYSEASCCTRNVTITSRSSALAADRQNVREIHEELARQYEALVDQAELHLEPVDVLLLGLQDVLEQLARNADRTGINTTLAVALNYGAQDELVRAANAAGAAASDEADLPLDMPAPPPAIPRAVHPAS